MLRVDPGLPSNIHEGQRKYIYILYIGGIIIFNYITL